MSFITLKEMNNLANKAKEKYEEEKKLSKPKVILESGSYTNDRLISLATNYMIDSEGGREIDSEYGYELVMELVYGKGVWNYLNNL